MAPVTAEVLGQALEVARAAYHEAMGRAGMLRGKVAEVHAYAETLIAELDREDTPQGDPSP
ncbi:MULTISPECIES: hypothetical protein [Actinomadura]|uniref:Uncharacterized protein n=1 Tax=Actinomadura yumaensis TaxID=111807 RepID=A0ABW2CGA2_9ACTN|nr:hypothetical protein [Actinomadura sp. J1-007]MWK34600.1 hypothetical protein [Actinomadura sp. J1-007]